MLALTLGGHSTHIIPPTPSDGSNSLVTFGKFPPHHKNIATVDAAKGNDSLCARGRWVPCATLTKACTIAKTGEFIVTITNGGLVRSRQTWTAACSGGGTTANVWIDSNGGTCIRSSSLVIYNDATACSSTNAAYLSAASGDTVRTTGSLTLTSQTISIDATKNTTDVTFIMASTSQMDGTFTVDANDVTFQDWKWCCQTDIVKDQTEQPFINGNRVTFNNIDSSSFQIQQGTGSSFIGGDVGPCFFDDGSRPICIPRIFGNADSATVKNIAIHDQIQSGALGACGNPTDTCHTDGMAIFGATNVLLDGNVWYNNDITNIRLQNCCGNNPNSNITIQNNFFGVPYDSNGNVRLDGIDVDSEIAGLVIQFNSFAYKPSCGTGQGCASQIQYTPTTTYGTTGSPAIIRGNAGLARPPQACGGNATFSYNYFRQYNDTASTGTCGTGDVVVAYNLNQPAYVANPGFVSGPTTTIDFHVTGTFPGDSMVVSGCIAQDIDGNTRPGTNCDAGADERVNGVSAAVFVSSTGNDGTCVRGNASLPCASFNKAYTLAAGGEIVEVAAGSYAYQAIVLDATKNTTDVTIQPASGATVNVAGGQFGDNGGSSSAKHVVLKGMNFTGVWQLGSASDSDTILNGTGRAPDVLGGTNDTVKGGSYGPCNAGSIAPTNPDCTARLQGTNQVVDGVSYHDVSQADAIIPPDNDETHTEDIFVRGCTNCTIRNSKFYNTGSSANVFIQNCCLVVNDGLTIEDNFFGPHITETNPSGVTKQSQLCFTCEPQHGQNLVFSSPVPNAIVRFNSFHNYCGTTLSADYTTNSCGSFINCDTTCGTAASPIQIYGNLMGHSSIAGGSSAPSCFSNETRSYNLYYPFNAVNGENGPCTGTGNVLTLLHFPYVNEPVGSAQATTAPNYHITSSSWAGNNIVANAKCILDPTDIDGDTRGAGGASCDAGADQF